MLNRVVLMGRLTREPELKRTRTNKAVCTITLAVERSYADSNGVREADFLDVVCWDRTAEFVAKYFRKGLLVACEGRLQTRGWKDKYEQNRVSVEVVADSVYFAERADKPEAAAAQRPAGAPVRREPIPQMPNPRVDVSGPDYGGYGLPVSDYAPMEDDDDVPF